jgi:RNA recognition motif-containing protein
MSSSNTSITSITTSTTTQAQSTGRAATHFPKKIFMEVSPSTSETELAILIKQFGVVIANAHIPKNEHGLSRGLTFVTFRCYEDAAYAMQQLQGARFQGLILHPRWANNTNRRKEVSKRKRSGSRKKQKASPIR